MQFAGAGRRLRELAAIAAHADLWTTGSYEGRNEVVIDSAQLVLELAG